MHTLSKPLRRTTLFIIFFSSVLLGIVLGRFISYAAVLLLLIPALFCAGQRKLPVATICLVLCLGLAVGALRGVQVKQKLHALAPYENKKITVIAIAREDALYATKSKLQFDTDHALISADKVSIPGIVQVGGFGELMVYKDDLVKATGKLVSSKGSRQFHIGFSQLQVLRRGGSWNATVYRNFTAGLHTALPEPESSFAAGLLLGQRTSLPKQTSDVLSAVGLTHIVAVSGYNLTILVNVVHRIGGKKSKYRSLLFSLGLIAAFITITGVSASIARAALVSGLGLIAWYYGREIRPLLLIVLSAAITALINPLYLWSDIGWYLSFLAFFGILLLAPLISKRIFKAKEPNFLWSLLIETIAAQTMTLPLILYIFGRLSVLALVANALVVPFIPIAMVLSLIAGLAGIFLPMFAGWLVWPAKWLLMYMIDIATTISRFPHALVAVQLSWVQLVICYGFIIGVLLVLWHRQPAKNPAVVV